MRNAGIALMALTAVFTCGGVARAQMIDFGAPVNIDVGNASDVATNGTYVDALQTFNASSAISVLNPTTHVATTFNIYTSSGSVVDPPANTPSNYFADGTFSITANGDGGGDGSNSTATPYQSVLNGSTYVNYPAETPTEVGTVTLSGLTPGDDYQLQVWASAGYRNVTYSSLNSQNLNYVSNSTGQYVIGTFIAPVASTGDTTSSEYFTYYNTYPIDVSAGEINAISLRDLTVPEPGTVVLMLVGLTVLGFCAHRKVAYESARQG